MQRYSFSFLLIAAISGVIMFYNLGGIPLLDPDEPVYAETPKEMYIFQDFLSPRIFGEYWYDKPPMYYWLVAGAYKLFGISEFAARFPSAVLGVLCILTVYLYVRKLFDKGTALASALVLATSIEYFYLAKAAVTDITLNLFLTLCLLSFISKHYYPFYFWAGLATLTKGPIGLVFPGAIVLIYLLITRQLSELKKVKLPVGIIIFIISGLPWYIAMYNIHGSAFIETFLGFHNITRFTTPEHPEGVLWYYYIPVLILGFFPWISISLQSVWQSLSKGGSKRDYLLFLNIWAFFIFIFFTISRTKLVSYILPMYPPLAIITGWYINKLWSERKRLRGWPVVLATLTALLIAALILGLRQMPELRSGALSLIAVLGLMSIGVIYFAWRRQYKSVFWTKIIAMTIFSMVLTGTLLPAAAPNFASNKIAQEFKENYDGTSPVYIIKFLRPGFAYYSDIYGREVVDAEQLSREALKPGHAYFVIRELDYKRLNDAERSKLIVVTKSADKLVLIKQ